MSGPPNGEASRIGRGWSRVEVVSCFMAQAERAESSVIGAESHEEGRRGGLSVVLWVLVVIVIYVLSVGPAAKLHDEGVIPDSASVVYSPLIFLSEHSTAADAFFRWYVRDVWKAGY